MQEPSIKTGSRWKVTAIVLGAVALGLAVFGVLAAVGLWWGLPTKLTEQDREVLVVAAELAPMMDEEFVLRSDAESFSKTRFFDGRTELRYDYEHPDPDAPLRLASQVTVAPTRAEARSIYRAWTQRMVAIAQGSGYRLEEREVYFATGDASRYAVLLEGEAVAGRLLAGRYGERVFFLELTGVDLDEGLFGELVAPSLQSLETYSP